jgi:GNAT superfamily N-acetyltransferase
VPSTDRLISPPDPAVLGLRVAVGDPALDELAGEAAAPAPETYAFAGPSYVEHGLRQWWSAEAIERSLENTTVLVAEQDGEVVATGNIDLRPDVPIIWKLYVIPLAQGTGVGSALIRELLAVAAGRPVRLEYSGGNDKADAFYARHGFTEIGRELSEPNWPTPFWAEHPGKLS